MIYLLLVLTFVVRIFDGVEHGLHWYSSPRRNNGEDFHTADLLQTWAVRGIYLTCLYLLVGLSWSLIPLFLGVTLIDQAVWQMFLNKYAGNGWLSGELDEAEFTWWPTSGKTFANEMRVIQVLLGIALLLLGLFTIL